MFKKIVLFILLFITTILSSNEKVSLQLLWKHQFEFAGFYMAKEKGFYDAAGLDVDFQEFQKKTNILYNLKNEKSTFALMYPSVVLDKSNGANIVLLNAILQSSPHVIISLDSSNIKNFSDFKNKKIMIDKNTIKTAPLISMLYSKQVDLSDMK